VVLVKNNHVIEALAAERPDDSFDDGARRRRMNRRHDAVDADAPRAPAEVTAIDGIPIV
jgi:hypothetical protein